jgi:hypothetical protein
MSIINVGLKLQKCSVTINFSWYTTMKVYNKKKKKKKMKYIRNMLMVTV